MVSDFEKKAAPTFDVILLTKADAAVLIEYLLSRHICYAPLAPGTFQVSAGKVLCFDIFF